MANPPGPQRPPRCALFFIVNVICYANDHLQVMSCMYTLFNINVLQRSNAQGSLGFAKRNENFLFFNITDANAFKHALKQLIPAITTTAQIQKFRQEISDHKKSGSGGLIKFTGINISFTSTGLKKV